uniref:BTB domain-containing protein n=1 Tax=Panagrellus redivivus TaxID=6233 RepID=A0A7E4VEQ1_PANRE
MDLSSSTQATFATLTMTGDHDGACSSMTEDSNGTVYKSAEMPARALENINLLRQNEQLCDVALIVEGSRIPCHRVWLSSCSNYFRAMFTNQMAESRQQEVQMIDIDYDTLRALVDFCYTAEIVVNENNVQQLLPASCLLQMREIQGFCCEFLKNHLDASNCLGIRSFADTHSCRELYRTADAFMRSKMEDILKCEEFLQLPTHILCEILSLDELDVTEEHAFNAVMRWIEFDQEKRLPDLSKILEHVRLSLCSRHFLVHTVSNNQHIKADIKCRDLVDEAKNLLLLPQERTDLENERHRPRVPARCCQLLFAVGGWCKGDAIASVECMDSRSGQWRSVRPMLKRRCGVGVAVLAKALFAVGGHDGSKYLRCVERYDPLRNHWFSDVAPTSTCRTSVGVAVHEDYGLFAVGGQDGVSCLDIVERYDAHRNEWIKVAPMKSRRLGVSVSVLNGCLYAVGGADGQKPLYTVERYDPRCDSWNYVQPMSTRRKHLGSAVLGNLLYAVGGRADNCELNSAEKYDPVLDEWLPVVSLNNRRSGVGLAVVNEQLYAIGGFDGCDYLNSVEALEEDPHACLDDLTSSPHWRNAGNMSYRRLGGGVGVISLVNDELSTCSALYASADAASAAIRACYTDLA